MDKSNENKKTWTEEERLELAAKLDAELDEYINSLEKKSYTEGWAEDKWQEEMEKHPFFMKKPPEPGDELSPLMEGLQQLKYGKDENTPEGTLFLIIYKLLPTLVFIKYLLLLIIIHLNYSSKHAMLVSDTKYSFSYTELANNYKEDGNFNYKYKKYRLAILSYTEGIRTKCKDNDLMAQLYNNRAAAHFMLQNYR